MPRFNNSLSDELVFTKEDPDSARKIYTKVLDALIYAHSCNVLHRDLKPGNILLGDDETVVVTDFGLSRQLNAETTRFTRTGQGGGTEFYSAPEQLADFRKADARSDIYSLGILLYALHTGPVSAILRIDKLSQGLQVIVEKCLAAPDHRFNSVSELKAAWLDVYKHEQIVIDTISGDKSIEDLQVRPEDQPTAQKSLNYLLARISEGQFIFHICMTLPTVALRTMEMLDRNSLLKLSRTL